MHYRSKCCGGHHDHDTLQLSKTAGNKLSRLTEKYVRELFDEYEVSPKLRTELWEYYFTTLSKGLDLGYNPKVPYYSASLAERLRKNIAEFSAFKETSFKKSLHSILTEDKQRLIPWSEFKKKAEGVADNYNKKWLKTECDHTIANANTAAQWGKFEAQKHIYPNIEFFTIGDNAVRDEHEALNGFIAPVDDDAWNELAVPIDWGCRCGIKQTDAEPSEKQPNYKPKQQFANNPAKSGEVFKNGGAYGKHLDKAEKAGALRMAEKQMRGKETWEEIPTKKGKLRISSLHGVEERKENIRIASYFTNKYGYKIDLIARSNTKKTADAYNKTLRVMQEYKCNQKATKGAIDNAIRKASKQAEHIVLEIKSNIDNETLERGIKGRVKWQKNIKTITVIRDNSDKTYSRSEILSKKFKL